MTRLRGTQPRLTLEEEDMIKGVTTALVGASVWLAIALGEGAVLAQRSVAELQLMSDTELAIDASDACMVQLQGLEGSRKMLTAGNPAASQRFLNDAQQAGAYLARIGLVARARHGGTYPAWMSRFLVSKTPADCQQAVVLAIGETGGK